MPASDRERELEQSMAAVLAAITAAGSTISSNIKQGFDELTQTTETQMQSQLVTERKLRGSPRVPAYNPASSNPIRAKLLSF